MFKFISDPSAAKYLLEGQIKFTPPHELNDPSELVPNVVKSDVLASLKRLRAHGYSREDLHDLWKQGKLLARLAPEFQAIGVPKSRSEANALVKSAFYDDVDRLESLLSHTAQLISSRVGVFCFTQRFNSLPMWAHYANNARGVVVEFQSLDEVFTGDDTGILNQIVAVRYDRERRGVTFEPRSHESLFFAKFADWAYEQECRVVLPLSSCKSFPARETNIHVFEVPKRHVRRIIVGWNISNDACHAVEQFVRDINPEVTISKAVLERGKVQRV